MSQAPLCLAGEADAGASTCHMLSVWRGCRPDPHHILQIHTPPAGLWWMGWAYQELAGWAGGYPF